MYRQADVLEIVLALRSACSFAGGLDGGQEQGYQDADNRDDN
jgi:hypothetical protein